MSLTLRSAIATFGKSAKAKLTNPGARGEPEDQLRAPLERLFADLAELSGLDCSRIAAVGESSLTDMKTRPDYGDRIPDSRIGFYREDRRCGICNPLGLRLSGRAGRPSRP
jgi:hypothetical protein